MLGTSERPSNFRDCWNNTPPTYTFQADMIIDEVHTTVVPKFADIKESIFTTQKSNRRKFSSPIRIPGVKAAKETRKKVRKYLLQLMSYTIKLYWSYCRSQKQHLEQINTNGAGMENVATITWVESTKARLRMKNATKSIWFGKKGKKNQESCS